MSFPSIHLELVLLGFMSKLKGVLSIYLYMGLLLRWDALSSRFYQYASIIENGGSLLIRLIGID